MKAVAAAVAAVLRRPTSAEVGVRVVKSGQVRARLPAALSLALIALILVANLIWLREHRFGMLLDIDEAGYVAWSMSFARAAMGGGFVNWLHALSSPMATAPLLPALASLQMWVFGLSENVALTLNAFLSALLLLVVFGIAARLSHAAGGFLAVVLVGTMPMIADFSRNFHFAMAATLFFTAALYCHCRSDGFAARTPSILCGGCLALMCLARTMTVAFVPAFVVVFLAHTYVVYGIDKRRAQNILLSIGAAILVGGPWYIKNFRSVFSYLVSFGYGQAASEYGSDNGFFTFSNLVSRAELLFIDYRPLHFIIVLPIFILGFIFIWRNWRGYRQGTAKSLVPYYSVLAVGCLCILATSRNIGKGFELPILPLMAAIAAAHLARWKAYHAVRNAVAGVFIVACLVLGYGTFDTKTCVVWRSLLWSPDLLPSPFIDCRDPVTSYVEDFGGMATEAAREGTFDPVAADGWRAVSAGVAREIARFIPGHDRGVAFASRHLLMNVNTVSLYEIKELGAVWPVTQIEPTLMANTEAGYRQWLTSGTTAQACLVLLLTDTRGEFKPRPDTAHLTQALSDLGYRVAATIPTPTEGQRANLWLSPKASCRQAATTAG